MRILEPLAAVDAVIAAVVAWSEITVIALNMATNGYYLIFSGRLNICGPCAASDLSKEPTVTIGLVKTGLPRDTKIMLTSSDNVSGRGTRSSVVA